MKMSFHLIFIVIGGNSGNLEIFIEQVTHSFAYYSLTVSSSKGHFAIWSQSGVIQS